MGYFEYEDVAPNYYDAIAHPTCANFRCLTVAVFARWAAEERGTGVIVELGAGATILPEVLAECDLERVILLDKSRGMLSYNDQTWTRLLADSTAVPLRSASVDVLFASLADPYNTEAFWAECGRLVCPGGRVYFSSPAFGWAQKYREAHGDPLDVARFETKNGFRSVPSCVVSAADQKRMAFAAGFEMIDVQHRSVKNLPPDVPVSARLRSVVDAHEPVLSAYLLERIAG